MASPARDVAAARNIPIVTLVPDVHGPAGAFSLRTEQTVELTASQPGFADADDIALVLHTSGTTSRPKLVPLSHRNVTASARNIGRVLELSPGDVCLNIMPLFHIHGLIAATLSSIAAGASVSCTPGFNGLRFFHWFDEVRPTWYTAVPSMHQAILARAGRHPESLRITACDSSARHPRHCRRQSCRRWRTHSTCPVVESYGMTEAAHQMASNPLPPSPRYPGSVGIAAGPEVGIMDEAGQLLAPGVVGEVVIRGENVTSGYVNNPSANASAFKNGWFRTGDQGYLDAAGYLRLTGRLKELINRGGEKVSPLEVDEVLMDHPAVAQAVTFAIPHAMLGEEIAAAVVLREGSNTTEREIRDFVALHLVHFKVPRHILFLTEVPKGPTGKVQRIGLAQQLGFAR